ncbi:hypothetical protein GW916_05970 [bacterium]|nr:hypothetical protein [bacterium]
MVKFFVAFVLLYSTSSIAKDFLYRAKNNVNIRGTSCIQAGNQVGLVKEGDIVLASDHGVFPDEPCAKSKEWFYLRSGKTSGHAVKENFERLPEDQVATLDVRGRAWLKSSPCISGGKIIGSFGESEMVAIIQRDVVVDNPRCGGPWSRVQVDGKRGYMMKEYLKFLADPKQDSQNVVEPQIDKRRSEKMTR